ncbi:MAG TPA: HEXXH motif domain-containing protein [Streptosporangiaceae bacterium]|nr:HEXXH motif domain-containing protein [Streptosporangiaceae bacterium]
MSKHMMLLHAISAAADGGRGKPAPASDRRTTPAPASGRRGPSAFRAGHELLARVQVANPAAAGWLLGLPHLGGWLHDCLLRLDQGADVDFGHFACLAAAAAVRGGLGFELDVPVRDGQIRLPGLGSLHVAGQPDWIRLRCDGDQVQAGDEPGIARRRLVPDDGSTRETSPRWSGTPVVLAVADGVAWHVLLETSDPYLDRYSLPMSAGLTPGELAKWRRGVQAAWEVLVRHHRWAADPVASGVSVIVPLMPRSDTDFVSATTQAAFGAIATSWPPDPVTLAETVVHEFQHGKLCGLMDLVPLIESGEERVYAPWRQDPRPAGGLLQGIYAHLGIVRFWQAQRLAETEPDDILRAQVHFARWGQALDLAIRTLLEADSLNADGLRFVTVLQARARDVMSGTVPGDASQIAGEVALDHRLTWQLRHLATDAGEVAGLAAAYRRRAPFPGHVRGAAGIAEDIRKVGSTARSRMLNMRYLGPARFRELLTDGNLALGEADRVLLAGRSTEAVQAYRNQIAESADPRPDAWIGLALALHRLPATPAQAAFATRLPLLFDVHACLSGRVDPVDLADWFG